MVVVCWSVKGGSGTTVLAACLAAVAAQTLGRSTLLVDLGGDLPAAVGVDDPGASGVVDWLATATTSRRHDPPPMADAGAAEGSPVTIVADADVAGLEVSVGDRLSILPRGSAPVGAVAASTGELLAARLGADGRFVVVDAGTRPPGGPPTPADRVIEAADRSLLVVRPCYLALRHVTRARGRIDGVVVVEEPGRSLGADDVSAVTGAPVVARVRVEPQVARVVDAGLLTGRMPHAVERAMLDILGDER